MAVLLSIAEFFLLISLGSSTLSFVSGYSLDFLSFVSGLGCAEFLFVLNLLASFELIDCSCLGLGPLTCSFFPS